MSDSDTGTEVREPQPVSQPLIPPFLPHAIRRLAVPVLLLWLGLVVITNVAVPQLEVVGKAHSVSMSPKNAPSLRVG